MPLGVLYRFTASQCTGALTMEFFLNGASRGFGLKPGAPRRQEGIAFWLVGVYSFCVQSCLFQTFKAFNRIQCGLASG